MDYESVVRNVVSPLVVNKDALLIRALPSDDERHVTVLVCAESNDIARLIGKGGVTATAIREVVNVAGKINGTRVFVKFESYETRTEEE